MIFSIKNSIAKEQNGIENKRVQKLLTAFLSCGLVPVASICRELHTVREDNKTGLFKAVFSIKKQLDILSDQNVNWTEVKVIVNEWYQNEDSTFD